MVRKHKDTDPNRPEPISEPVRQTFDELAAKMKAAWSRAGDASLYAIYEGVPLLEEAHDRPDDFKVWYSDRRRDSAVARLPETQIIEIMLEGDGDQDALSTDMRSDYAACLCFMADPVLCPATNADEAVAIVKKNGRIKGTAGIYRTSQGPDFIRPGPKRGAAQAAKVPGTETTEIQPPASAALENLSLADAELPAVEPVCEPIGDTKATPPAAEAAERPEATTRQYEYESDTMEAVEADIDVAAELGALGPEPPVNDDPPPRSDGGMSRFIGALKIALLGATPGERESGVAAMRRLPGHKEIVEKIADAVENAPDEGGWSFIQYMKDQLNSMYKRTEWATQRYEVTEKALQRTNTNRAIENKNLDRVMRVNSALRLAIESILRNGIPPTRADLDTLVKRCQLSQAKNFMDWLDRVWSEIEANPNTDPEITLLRERIAVLTEENRTQARQIAKLEELRRAA